MVRKARRTLFPFQSAQDTSELPSRVAEKRFVFDVMTTFQYIIGIRQLPGKPRYKIILLTW
jgi:hypothetical protein